MSTQEKPAKSGYPEVLLSQLPEAKVAFEGARAWIMQSESNQLVFFEFEAGMNLPDHNHTYPQWGMVMEGEMELRLNGKPQICKKGDEYLIGARRYAWSQIHQANTSDGFLFRKRQIHTQITH